MEYVADTGIWGGGVWGGNEWMSFLRSRTRKHKVMSETQLFQHMEFERTYANWRRNGDYILQKDVVKPEFWTMKTGSMFRYMFRMCWRCHNYGYMPITFLVDTGAMESLYLCKEAIDTLRLLKVLTQDDDSKHMFVTLCRRGDGTCERPEQAYRVRCYPTPKAYEPANIVGLRFVQRFGFVVDGDSFRFHNMVDFLGE
jgi:hypothetical protein